MPPDSSVGPVIVVVGRLASLISNASPKSPVFLHLVGRDRVTSIMRHGLSRQKNIWGYEAKCNIGGRLGETTSALVILTNGKNLRAKRLFAMIGRASGFGFAGGSFPSVGMTTRADASA